MFNCLLQGFPTEYQGYAINTDFRVGILLTQLTEDESVEEDLKLLQAFNILYKDKIPEDFQVAYSGLEWFLSCGKSEIYYEEAPQDNGDNSKSIDFSVDHLDIWGAFWSKGVDLTKVSMHWFKFMAAIGNVGDCPLTQKMQFRSADLSKMKGDTRKYYAELKEKYKVRKIMTKEEHDEYIKKLEKTNGSYYMKLRALNGGN